MRDVVFELTFAVDYSSEPSTRRVPGEIAA